MSKTSWSCIPHDSDSWWDNAYHLFLQSKPLEMLNTHYMLLLQRDTCNDYRFDIWTPVNVQGAIKDIDKRAILVVVARARKMYANTWSQLKPVKVEDSEDIELSALEVATINTLTSVIFTQQAAMLANDQQ